MPVQALVLWLVVIALTCAAGVFVFRHRSYFREVAAVIAVQRQPVPQHSTAQKPESLGLYYIFAGSETRSRITPGEHEALAREWTPPVAYGVNDHPVAIAQDGLVSFNRYVTTGDARFLARAAAAADELLRLQEPDGAWKYSFAFIDLEAGWSSAMAQGQAVSLLLRVSQAVSEGSRYVESARAALAFSMRSVSEGGTLGAFDDGTPFLEEYPGSSLSPLTLNGSIFALWGVRDWALVMHDDDAMQDFESLTSGLAAHLGLYDTGSWTRYSLRSDGEHLADLMYHRVHIAQACVMAEITGDSRWRSAYDIWTRHYARKVSRNPFIIWWRDTADRARVLRKRMALPQ